MEDTVEINRAWLETLLKYAERTDKLLGENYKDRLKYDLAGLLGYISSAKHLL